MQKTFYILLSLLFCTSFHTLHAQDFPKKGDYVQNNQINHFAGNWKWQSGDSIVLIQFRKEIIVVPKAEYSVDGFRGDVVFTIGAQTIRDSFNSNVKAFIGICGYPVGVEKSMEFKLGYVGSSHERSGDIILKCLDNDCNTLQWELRESPGIKVYLEGEPWPQDFSLPRRMVLTREAPARRPQGN